MALGRTGRWIAVVIALLPALLGARAVDPPEVTGLPLAEAERLLRDWEPKVVIAYAPPLTQLPPEIDRSRLVAAKGTWLNPDPIDSTAPRVEVALGALVPDLTGLTADQARDGLAPLGLRDNAIPATAGDDWLVTGQRPKAGTVVPLRSLVTAILSLPTATASPTPIQPGPPARDRWVPVAAVTGGGLLVLALLGTLVLRRRRRRGRGGPERIETRAFAGPPPTVELTGTGPPVSVRLVAGYAPSTVRLEEP